MRDQPTGSGRDPSNKRTQRLVLGLVIDKKQRPWSIEEIGRALEGTCSKLDIEDAVIQLRCIGLINQAEELVFASLATAHMDKLEMLSV